MNSLYRSNYGVWTPILLLTGVVVIPLIFFLLIRPEHIWIGITIISIPIIYLIYLYRSTTYEIKENQLFVKCGYKKLTLDITEIRSVTKTFSFHNIPDVYALSEKRVRIVYGMGKSIFISPSFQEKFIQELTEKNPKIRLDT